MKKLFLLTVVALMGVTANAQIVSSTSRQITREVDYEVEDKDDYKHGWDGIRFNLDAMFNNYEYGNGTDNFTGAGFSMGYSKGICFNKKVPFVLEIAPVVAFDWHEREYRQHYYSYDWWSGKGYSYWADESADVLHLAINLPVNIGYNIRFGHSSCAFYPYMGFTPKVNILLRNGDDDFFDDEVGYDGNRFQVDWQIGGLLRLAKFNLGIEYHTNLIPVCSNNSFDFNQSGVRFSLGFNF